jgi:hypothetical protein
LDRSGKFPYTPFLALIVEELEKRNNPYSSPRDCFQINELFDLFHLNGRLSAITLANVDHDGFHKIIVLSGEKVAHYDLENLRELAGQHGRRERTQQDNAIGAVPWASNRGRARLRRVTAVSLPNNCPIPMPGTSAVPSRIRSSRGHSNLMQVRSVGSENSHRGTNTKSDCNSLCERGACFFPNQKG